MQIPFFLLSSCSCLVGILLVLAEVGVEEEYCVFVVVGYLDEEEVGVKGGILGVGRSGGRFVFLFGRFVAVGVWGGAVGGFL